MTAPEIRFLAVIPVYNHGDTLRRVAERTLAVHPDVLVVDDGSTDDGAATLEGLPVRLIRFPANRGKGAAILRGAEEARRLGMSHIIVLDADGQHDPADIPRFLPAMRLEPSAIVVGRRDFSAPGVPGSSRFGRSFSNFWLRVQTGVELGDTQSGFRAYPLAMLEHLRLWERRYSFEVEVLVKAAWAGVPLREVDVSVAYPPERVSHFHALWDNLRLSKLNTGLTMRSLLPWPHRQLAADSEGAVRITVLHPLRAIRAMLAEKSTPAELAAAVALGVLIGALPLFFLHTVAILVAAGFFRLNRLTAVAASHLCVPPLVPALCIETGHLIRHGRFLTELSLRTVGYEAPQRLWEWIIGSLVVGPVLAMVVGAVTFIMALAVKRGLHAAA